MKDIGVGGNSSFEEPLQAFHSFETAKKVRKVAGYRSLFVPMFVVRSVFTYVQYPIRAS
jgi:hypothetical protein